MAKIKISDLLTEFSLTNEEFTQKLHEFKIKLVPRVKTLTEEEAKNIRDQFKKKEVSLTETRKGDIVEKRVQTSVIRRRKVEELPPQVSKEILRETPKEVQATNVVTISTKESAKKTKEAVTALPPAEPERSKVPKLNIVATPVKPKSAEVPSEISKKEKEQKLLEEEELAKKRRKAMIKRRTEEFDIHGFNRSERIYQPKKKKMVVDRSKMLATSLTVPNAEKRVIKISGQISVSEFADQLKVKSTEIIKKLMSMGMMITANQPIDAETAQLIAQEYNYEVKSQVLTETDFLKREVHKDQDLELRPPVVTIMGHVDHGKTTLLDAIRKTDVASGEAGGITQHIGAYMVDIGNNRMITFIDTPGHEAFSAMRARGAKTTDIVILVVAADDGVMPQTKEAIAHAREAKVPIIVAVNKIDKPGAQPDRIMKQLADLDLLPEEWGGKTILAKVSAKEKKGIKELLELILLQADVLELKASSKMLAEGVVLEAKMAKGLGPVATVLVQAGTLAKGDLLVVGTSFGKVRLILDDKGRQLKEALPSFAVEVSGLDIVPAVGDQFTCFKNESDARTLIEFRQDQKRALREAPVEKMSLEGLYAKMQEGQIEELKLIVKADVQGSIEVLQQTLEKLSTPKVKLSVIFSSTGAISESDVNLASASNAIIIGFNIRPDVKAQELSKNQKVDIKLYSIIYEVMEDMKKAMVGKLQPVFKETTIGRAEVRNVFKISKVGTVAGCSVVTGKMTRTCKVRLLRDSVVIYTGKVEALKRFKDDAKEVLEGYECGISLENFNDIKEKDVIEGFIVEGVEQTL